MSDYDDDRSERNVAADPDVDDRGRKWPGVAAVALFVVLAAVFVGAPFGDPAGGFEGDAGITASIGYSMFNIDAPDAVPSEGFLVTFILIAVALDAALDAAVMLASREEEGELTTALQSDAAEGESSPDVVADGGERTDGEGEQSEPERRQTSSAGSSRSSSDRQSDGGDLGRSESVGSEEVED